MSTGSTYFNTILKNNLITHGLNNYFTTHLAEDIQNLIFDALEIYLNRTTSENLL
jgi:hypothetical protein